MRCEATPRDDPAQDDCIYRNPPARFVRGLLALLATPFLLLAMLVIGFWLTASGKLTASLTSGEGDRPVSSSHWKLGLFPLGSHHLLAGRHRR